MQFCSDCVSGLDNNGGLQLLQTWDNMCSGPNPMLPILMFNCKGWMQPASNIGLVLLLIYLCQNPDYCIFILCHQLRICSAESSQLETIIFMSADTEIFRCINTSEVGQCSSCQQEEVVCRSKKWLQGSLLGSDNLNGSCSPPVTIWTSLAELCWVGSKYRGNTSLYANVPVMTVVQDVLMKKHQLLLLDKL